jgi:hypothetical protein
VKPLLDGLVLTVSDEIIAVGADATRVYVKATATVSDGKDSLEVTAFAREPETKKGMDASQITGTASSYARKYALNGLLLIDDNKDADTDEHKKQSQGPDKAKAPKKTTAKKEDKPAEEAPKKRSGFRKKTGAKNDDI